jgi:hypothetical protein
VAVCVRKFGRLRQALYDIQICDCFLYISLVKKRGKKGAKTSKYEVLFIRFFFSFFHKLRSLRNSVLVRTDRPIIFLCTQPSRPCVCPFDSRVQPSHARATHRHRAATPMFVLAVVLASADHTVWWVMLASFVAVLAGVFLAAARPPRDEPKEADDATRATRRSGVAPRATGAATTATVARPAVSDASSPFPVASSPSSTGGDTDNDVAPPRARAGSNAADSVIEVRCPFVRIEPSNSLCEACDVHSIAPHNLHAYVLRHRRLGVSNSMRCIAMSPRHVIHKNSRGCAIFSMLSLRQPRGAPQTCKPMCRLLHSHSSACIVCPITTVLSQRQPGGASSRAALGH